MLADTVIVSVLVGKARKGKLSKLGKMPVKKHGLIIGAFLIQAAMVYFGMKGIEWVVRYGFYLHLASFIMLLTGIFYNRHIKEMLIIGFGIFLNFTVIFLNGGRMPVSLRALERAGMIQLADILKTGKYTTHTVMSDSTVLKFLGDIFFLPSPYPRPRVFSIGDGLMALGLFLLIQRYMVDKRGK
ncbi:MAG: hypothetical protein PWR14_608 [Thermosediminibacterales bacterium]|jgi:hypothetical protein|nr:hypothetical protein [Thermosediminibacterales bacterium]